MVLTFCVPFCLIALFLIIYRIFLDLQCQLYLAEKINHLLPSIMSHYSSCLHCTLQTSTHSCECRGIWSDSASTTKEETNEGQESGSHVNLDYDDKQRKQKGLR